MTCNVCSIIIRNLREQHFRIKDGEFENDCRMVTEGKTSVNSKIVLKCWLDDKLRVNDVQSRVPIHHVDDNERKYEFSFLSKEKKIAVSYCHERVNLSSEKLEILESNKSGIKLMYIVDAKNGGCSGQYPEAMMRIQERQGYCLLLQVKNADYDEAVMKVVYYNQDKDGLWKENELALDQLKTFEIAVDGTVCYQGKAIDTVVCEHNNEVMRIRQAEIKRREEDFKRNIAENFLQQIEQVKDAAGNRWIKCEFCGRIAKVNEFVSYGGMNHVNLGTCKKCSSEGRSVVNDIVLHVAKPRITYDAMICPECGGKLRERNGRNGPFIGCSNYPECRYTRSIRRTK